ncbi:MAG: hypothetical protein HRU19_06025 [Pseudobacteriovorax sp.]|nr:hypothetical protein [Pseudobacteriovorax sp.]
MRPPDLTQVTSIKNIKTRFAPSPTGRLHLGHVLSAFLVYAIGKKVSAQLFLRIEDHDQGRSRQSHIDGILEDLTWLGFHFESSHIYLQSDHFDRYESYFQKLHELGYTYYCDCSRKTISRRIGTDKSQLTYDGYCRNRNLGPGEGRGVRIRQESYTFSWKDLFLGPQVQTFDGLTGDPLIRERQGNWTYQFAVAIDDLVESMNLIIRGEDITHATGGQSYIKSLIHGKDCGAVYGHHPLIVGPDHLKLSKRLRSTTISSLREQGIEPEEVFRQIAKEIGIGERKNPIGLSELIEEYWNGRT